MDQIVKKEPAAGTEQRKKRTFRKFMYRGVDLDQLLDMSKFCILTVFVRLAFFNTFVDIFHSLSP
ncbi:hypothetical protein Avbf_14601 [Armadillidium vulgare]|nr:hypothetical protein Avbf_14601 [Armadillidium vulgare]